MKKKVIWIVLALVLVGVLVGAGALYKKLSADGVPASPTASSAVLQTTEPDMPQTEPMETDLLQTEPTTEEAPQTEAETAGKKAAAADFTVLDADGNEVTLSSHFGKPLVVNFWTTWCGPCRSELPGFDAAAKTYADKIDFMMVNLTDGYRDTVDDVKAFVEESGFSFPVYFDTQQSAAAAYDVYGIPQTVFIYADGSVMRSYVGALPEDVLNGFLEELVQ